MPPATRRLLARFAAPIAFLLAATVAILLVRSALHAGDAPRGPDRGAVSRVDRGRHGKKPSRSRRGPGHRRAVYVTVEAGETLQTVADEHGTTVRRLLQLNPGVDPRSLHVGQRIRVR
jgi:hypothetical protein